MKLPASGRKPLDLCDYDVVIDSNQMYILHIYIDVYTLYLLAQSCHSIFFTGPVDHPRSRRMYETICHMDSLG